MLASFTPCMNLVSNSTASMAPPTPACCNSLTSLATSSSGCLCQILTGGVPFPVPVNRTTAISLPRSCNMAGAPLQCKAAAQIPGLSPAAAPSPSASAIIPTEPSPVADSVPAITPAASPASTTETPTSSTNSPAKTSNTITSAASPSFAFSPSLLILALALVMIKSC